MGPNGCARSCGNCDLDRWVTATNCEVKKPALVSATRVVMTCINSCEVVLFPDRLLSTIMVFDSLPQIFSSRRRAPKSVSAWRCLLQCSRDTGKSLFDLGVRLVFGHLLYANRYLPLRSGREIRDYCW